MRSGSIFDLKRAQFKRDYREELLKLGLYYKAKFKNVNMLIFRRASAMLG